MALYKVILKADIMCVRSMAPLGFFYSLVLYILLIDGSFSADSPIYFLIMATEPFQDPRLKGAF